MTADKDVMLTVWKCLHSGVGTQHLKHVFKVSVESVSANNDARGYSKARTGNKVSVFFLIRDQNEL